MWTALVLIDYNDYNNYIDYNDYNNYIDYNDLQ